MYGHKRHNLVPLSVIMLTDTDSKSFFTINNFKIKLDQIHIHVRLLDFVTKK
jgi:hypothetical protein